VMMQVRRKGDGDDDDGKDVDAHSDDGDDDDGKDVDAHSDDRED